MYFRGSRMPSDRELMASREKELHNHSNDEKPIKEFLRKGGKITRYEPKSDMPQAYTGDEKSTKTAYFRGISVLNIAEDETRRDYGR